MIHVRVTPADREAIISRATKSGKSVSDYVRGAALYWTGPVPEKQTKPDLPAIRPTAQQANKMSLYGSAEGTESA